MAIEVNSDIIRRLNQQAPLSAVSPIFGADGLKSEDIDNIESQLGFKLPPDLRFLLNHLDDSNGKGFTWKAFDLKAYEDVIEWLQTGIEFDIENGLWLAGWGERPENMDEAKSIFREDFMSWPRLVPLFGHRFLPVDPCKSGNPVFSIMQSDIIYYGSSLGTYLYSEFLGINDDQGDWFPKDYIPIWHDFAAQSDGFLTGDEGSPFAK